MTRGSRLVDSPVCRDRRAHCPQRTNANPALVTLASVMAGLFGGELLTMIYAGHLLPFGIGVSRRIFTIVPRPAFFIANLAASAI